MFRKPQIEVRPVPSSSGDRSSSLQVGSEIEIRSASPSHAWDAGFGIEIRPALPADVEALSALIGRSLRRTNAKHYPRRVIEAVARRYSAKWLQDSLAKRQVLVAVRAGIVVGTASLEGGTVQSVYVAPEQQGAGIGTSLMAAIEHIARANGVHVLRVPSSITAEKFYRRLGYVPNGQTTPGENRLIILNKSLSDGPSQPGGVQADVCMIGPPSL